MLINHFLFADATNDWSDEERWSQAETCYIPEQLPTSEGNAHQPRRPGGFGNRTTGAGRGSTSGIRQRDSQQQATGTEQQADALLSTSQGKRA